MVMDVFPTVLGEQLGVPKWAPMVFSPNEEKLNITLIYFKSHNLYKQLI